MPRPLRTDPASKARMLRNVATIDDPVAFARRYLHIRGYHGLDEDLLLDVAVEAILKAGLSWDDRDEGVSFTTWCWRYMDRDVYRQCRRARQDHLELVGDHHGFHGDWLRYDAGTGWYRRIEDRMLIHDLVERSQLSDRHRWIVEYAAHNLGIVGPRLDGETRCPITKSNDFKTAMRHLRKAARRHGYRDDEWTRLRARDRKAVA